MFPFRLQRVARRVVVLTGVGQTEVVARVVNGGPQRLEVYARRHLDGGLFGREVHGSARDSLDTRQGALDAAHT